VNSQGETRTRNPRINSPLLYRLSYLGPVINSHDLRASRFLCARLYTEMTHPNTNRGTERMLYLETYQRTSPKGSRTI
jgi:hypothetical protein